MLPPGYPQVPSKSFSPFGPAVWLARLQGIYCFVIYIIMMLQLLYFTFIFCLVFTYVFLLFNPVLFSLCHNRYNLLIDPPPSTSYLPLFSTPPLPPGLCNGFRCPKEQPIVPVILLYKNINEWKIKTIISCSYSIQPQLQLNTLETFFNLNLHLKLLTLHFQ